MASDFDQAFKELEEIIMEDIRRTYSEKVIEHFQNPRNIGEIENADGFGKVTGPCGDTMQIYLKMENSKIMEAKFMTDGCGTTIVCGSVVTELTKGKSIEEALKITKDGILDSLDGLPESDVHCSVLAANTLHEAIRDYLSLRKEPWKKFYRRTPL